MAVQWDKKEILFSDQNEVNSRKKMFSKGRAREEPYQ